MYFLKVIIKTLGSQSYIASSPFVLHTEFQCEACKQLDLNQAGNKNSLDLYSQTGSKYFKTQLNSN